MISDDEPLTIKRIMPRVIKWTEEEVEYFEHGMIKTRYMTKEEVEKEFGVKIK